MTKRMRLFWFGVLLAVAAGFGLGYLAQPNPLRNDSNAFFLGAVLMALFAVLPRRAIVLLLKLRMGRGWEEPKSFRHQVIYVRAIFCYLAVLFLVGQMVYWVRIGRL